MAFGEATVFIVDDDDAVRDSLGLLMKSVGLKARVFDSAESFLENYKPADTGCLVLDIRMPGMSGIELQRELSNRKWELPIIFITAHGDIPMAVEAVRNGALDFVQKPFDDKELVGKIEKALSESQQRQEDDLERAEIRPLTMTVGMAARWARRIQLGQISVSTHTKRSGS